MIYLTTFILALSVTQIARALPQGCRDPVLPDSSAPDGQFVVGPGPVIPTYKVVYNPVYDNPHQTLNDVACSELSSQFSQFHDIPTFPAIGGAPNTTFNSPNCGACWKVTNKANGKSTHFVGIDASSGFDFSEETFTKLGGSIGAGSFEATAFKIPASACGL